MTRTRKQACWLLVVAGLCLAFAARQAAADWLVTVDGQKVETAGPWQVKGRQVVFKAPNGTLSSLRLSEVDLVASEEATRLAKAPPPSPPPPAPELPKKKPVLVLTDKDVPRARPDTPAVPPAGEAAAGGETAAGASGGTVPSPPAAPGPNAPSPVVLVEWQQMEKDPTLGIEIMGTLRNTSSEIVTNVSVKVSLFGSDRELIADKLASLSPTTLAPGATTNFRVQFGDVQTFVTANFEIRSAAGARVVGAPPPATAR